MTDTDEPTEPWPESRATVRLLWEDGFVDVRVMRPVDDVTLLCTMADEDADVELPSAVSAIEVQWADDHGLWARPAVVIRRRFAMVTVEALGDVRREQRRRYYRAPVALDVEIIHDRQVYRGRTNDLSEGGARMTVEGTSPLPRARITTRVNLQQRQVSIPTTVVRSEHNGKAGELGVEFGEVPPAEADAIRRQVISAQIDERRKDRR